MQPFSPFSVQISDWSCAFVPTMRVNLACSTTLASRTLCCLPIVRSKMPLSIVRQLTLRNLIGQSYLPAGNVASNTAARGIGSSGLACCGFSNSSWVSDNYETLSAAFTLSKTSTCDVTGRQYFREAFPTPESQWCQCLSTFSFRFRDNSLLLSKRCRRGRLVFQSASGRAIPFRHAHAFEPSIILKHRQLGGFCAQARRSHRRRRTQRLQEESLCLPAAQ